MNTYDCISQFYNNYDEDVRLRSRHGEVEFLTTMRYIRKYLKPGAKIIEIGAGTGRYSHALANSGYHVDAVEFVPHNIDIFRSLITEGEPVTVTCGDARDLSAFGDNEYDITLLLGPMYHLFSRDEQYKALCEAARVTKPGGVIFIAYCMSDATIIRFGFMGGQIHEFIANDMIDGETFETKAAPKDIFELYRPCDIFALREQLGKAYSIAPLHFIASDGYTNLMRTTVDAMDDETFDVYLKYHFTVCERPDMTGFSDHTLDIIKKL